MQCGDFYQARELNQLLDYFERKGRGDVSMPVPALHVFEHVAGSAKAPFPLATMAERELRALYLGVGKPVSTSQAAEFTELWLDGAAAGIEGEIEELRSEIEAMESEIDRLRSQLDDKIAEGAQPSGYVPEDLMPLIGQLQREGA